MASACRWSTLADELEVEVAATRNSGPSPIRGASPRARSSPRAAPPAGAAPPFAFTPTRIFSARTRRSARRGSADGPRQGTSASRRRNRLVLRQEPAWSKDKTPETAVLHFPGGLADFAAEALGERRSYTPPPSPGRQAWSGRQRRPHGMGADLAGGRRGAVSSFCNTVPTPQGSTLSRACAPGSPARSRPTAI